MKTTKKLSLLFGLLGILLMLGTVALSFASVDAPARLLTTSKDVKQRTEAYMDALCRQDLETVGSLMHGQPRFFSEGEGESELAAYLWDAYTDSLSYVFTGDCYASGTSICRDVEVTMLDISGIMMELKERSQKLLEEHAALSDGDLVFEEDGQYREAFAMQVLYDGAVSILEKADRFKTVSLTLELVCQEGQWYIQSNPDVMNILTGGMGV